MSDELGQDAGMDEVWSRVAAELERRGKSASWLAARIGGSRQKVYNWKTRGIPPSSFPEVAAALGWSLDRVAGVERVEQASGLSPMALQIAVEFDRIKDDAAQLRAFAHIIGVIARAAGAAPEPPTMPPEPEPSSEHQRGSRTQRG